jgi:hypothetical protein
VDPEEAGATLARWTCTEPSALRACDPGVRAQRLRVEGGRILINGKEATSYTFKQDYFWLMGDNRHRSQDSALLGLRAA